MRLRVKVGCVLLCALQLAGCGRGEDPPELMHASADAAPLTARIIAAASLGSALEQLRPTAAEEVGVTLEVDLGSSGMLAQQIINGSSGDIFISANVEWMEELQRRGLLAGAPVLLLRNRLVCIASNEARPVHSLADLSHAKGRIAIGEPKSVPAGQYAEAALKASGVWEAVQSRLLPAVDVRAALTYVERGEADYGIVYRTDAMSSSAVGIAFVIDESLHEPIVYPAAVLKDTANVEASARLLRWFGEASALSVFRLAGFESGSVATVPTGVHGD